MLRISGTPVMAQRTTSRLSASLHGLSSRLKEQSCQVHSSSGGSLIDTQPSSSISLCPSLLFRPPLPFSPPPFPPSPLCHRFFRLSPLRPFPPFGRSVGVSGFDPRRSFHSSPPSLAVHGDVETDPAGKVGPLLLRWEQWKPRIVSYLYIGTAVLLGVLILRGGMWVVGFFSSLDFADVGEVAFIAGLLTAFTLMGVVALGRRALTLRPEAIYQEAVRQVLNDVTVRAYLGPSLHTGAFRAYSFIPGSIRWGGRGTSAGDGTGGVRPLLGEGEVQGGGGGGGGVGVVVPGQSSGGIEGWGSRAMVLLRNWWNPRRLQLFFQVTGDEGSHGMVSCEVVKVKGRGRYNLLAVDVLNTGQRIVLKGDPTYAIYQGVIKLR